MKQYLTIIVILLSLIVSIEISHAQNEADTFKLSEDLVIRKIEEDVYIVTHSFPWPANSLLCKLSSSEYILIDTPWENNATKLLYDWIKQNNSEFTLRVVNTHFHRDNLGGNGFLLENHIPVYGSDLTVKLLTERLNDPNQDNIAEVLERPKNRRYYEVFRETQLEPPNHIFKVNDGLTFEIGNEIVEVYYPGPGHTRDNIVVYFHKRNILFAGCIAKALSWKGLGFLFDADLNEYPNSLKKVLAKFPDAKIVIPGHGEYGDLSLIQHTLDLLENKN